MYLKPNTEINEQWLEAGVYSTDKKTNYILSSDR